MCLMIRVFCENWHQLGMREHVFNLLQDRARWRRSPTIVEYSIMLTSYAKEYATLKAAALFDEMLATGHRPDRIAYTTLIDVYAQSGKIEQAEQALNRTLAAGFSLDDRMVNILLNAAVRAVRPDLATRIFQRMLGAGLMPGEVTFCTLIQVYSDVGDASGVQHVLKLMHMVGVPLGLGVYAGVLTTTNRCHGVNVAFTMFQEWTKVNRVVSFFSSLSARGVW
jgi:pentatricopeptide repeat protein